MSRAEEPVFIAHRGEAARYPENSVASIFGAVRSGVTGIEIDIQLSADRVPVLSHDSSLLRTAGVDRLVSATLAAELTEICVGERHRFGATFAAERLPTLERVVEALDDAPPLTLFIELKRHSLEAFGRRRVLDAVQPVLQRSSHRQVVISFDLGVLRLARQQLGLPVGWVLPVYDETALQSLAGLQPEYVFCNTTRLPVTGQLPPGRWCWVLYEITDLHEVSAYAARGAGGFESMRASELLHKWRAQQ